MRIHAIQTGTVQIKELQRGGYGRGLLRLANTLRSPTWTEPLPIYAWVIEHPEGLIVIDTGDTARTAEPGYFPAWHPYYRLGVRLKVEPADEIGPRMRVLGLSPDDTRWLILTHMHTDHAGGLHHFPKAQVLVTRREYTAAQGISGRLNGYLPQHLPGWFAPRLIDFDGGPHATFPASHPLTRQKDVVLVPTYGHSPGQMAVLLHDGDRTICFAGDTTYTQAQLLEQIVDGVTQHIRDYQHTLTTMLAYVRQQPTVYLPSHDPDSARRLENRIAVTTSG